MNLPVIGVGQAKQLAGKMLRTGNREFIFGDEDSIRLGGQAIAIPLLNAKGRKVAFFRSSIAMAATPAKIERTSWLVGQRLHQKSEAFHTAPQLWFNSQIHGRPNEVSFDVAATIHGCAPGNSWKDWKEKVEFGEVGAPSVDQRLKFSRSLIQRLASLEAFGRSGFIHGDLSDGNIMLDLEAGKVHLIDFDCFVFDSPTLSQPKLHVDAGGSKGTPSYMPPSLEADTSLHLGPVSDRFARDMLLIELLAFQAGDPIDTSPRNWSGQEEMLDEISSLAKTLHLDHLLDVNVFSVPESERPSSFELASKLQINVADNTHVSLDDPVWLPSQIQPPSKHGRNPSSDSSEANVLPVAGLADWLTDSSSQLFESAKSTSRKVTSQIKREAQARSRAIVEIVLKASLWVVLFIVVFWVGIRCLFNFSFPANIVVAIAFFISISWLGAVTGVWSYLSFASEDCS